MTLSERAPSVLGNSRVVGATAVENIFVAINVIADANALFGFVVVCTTDKVCGVVGKSIFISDFDDCNFNAFVANAESCFSASIASVESFVAAVFSTADALVKSVVVAFFCEPEVKIVGEIEDAYTSFRGILVENLSLSTVSVTGLAALLDNCCCWCSWDVSSDGIAEGDACAVLNFVASSISVSSVLRFLSNWETEIECDACKDSVLVATVEAGNVNSAKLVKASVSNFTVSVFDMTRETASVFSEEAEATAWSKAE